MKTQRFFTATAVASIAALALAGCVQSSSGGSSSPEEDGSSESANKTVTVFLSADTNIQSLWQDSLIPAFEEANPGYNVEVDLDLHGEHDSQTMAKLTSATQQDKDPGFDLVDAGFVSQAAAGGLLTPVGTDEIPALADVPDNVIQAGGEGGIPYRGSSVLLAYNAETISTPPKTLDELLAWIKDNPGKFTYNTPDSGGSGQSFVTTVLDRFVPEDAREKMVVSYVPDLEKYWDEGFEKLASLNPYIYQEGVYPNGNAQTLDLLASGQIDVAPVWSDQFITGQKNGQIPENISYTQISDPSLTGGAAYLGIPKTSPNQEEALTLVNWLLTPEAQALMSGSIAGYPVISLDKLPADVQEQFENADISNLRLPYFSSMAQDMNRLWSERVPG